MKPVGLTGGIACGKSTAAGMFARLGFEVVDADDLAREVVAPGEPALAAVVAVFGRGVLRKDGTLDRGAVGRIVFRDAAARARLNAIVHPPVRERWRRRAAAARGPVLVVVPLLYEAGLEEDFSGIVAVGCGEALQRARLAARGLAPEEVEGRLEAQWPVARKCDRADWVVWNDGLLELLEAQVRRAGAAAGPDARLF